MSYFLQCADSLPHSKSIRKRNHSLVVTTNRHVMQVVSDAMKEPQFAAQWNQRSDVSFRPFAVAVFQLSNVAQLQENARRSIYQDLCIRKRTGVLTEIVGKPVRVRALKLLSRTRWNEFLTEDWLLFFSITTSDGRSALGHAFQITPTLVRQFELLPKELRLPGLLGVLSNLSVPAEWWANLAGFIHDAKGARLAELRRKAGSIKTNGDFWDFYFHCEGKHLLPFLTPPSFTESQLLETIKSSEEMMSEATRMKNCLASRTCQVLNGRRFFFRLRDGTPVNSELVRGGSGWIPGEILGYQNSQVTPETANAIEVELKRLALSIPQNWGSDGSEVQADHLIKLRHFARESFGTGDVERLTAALQSIHGRSKSWSNGAFAIFQHKHGGFVQFMSSLDDSEYLVEISSHKYQNRINKFLTSEAVSLLGETGFAWPTYKSNFRRWFNVSSTEDFRSMAEVALGILAKVFGHRAGVVIAVNVEFPY